MLTNGWALEPAIFNVSCAKSCVSKWKFVVLLLLESRNVTARNSFFLGRVCISRSIENCVYDRVRKMLSDAYSIRCTSLLCTADLGIYNSNHLPHDFAVQLCDEELIISPPVSDSLWKRTYVLAQVLSLIHI